MMMRWKAWGLVAALVVPTGCATGDEDGDDGSLDGESEDDAGDDGEGSGGSGSSGSSSSSSSGGSDDGTGDDDGADDTGNDDTTSGEDDDGDTNAGDTGNTCPEPPVEPDVVDNPELFCKDGFAFDQAYGMCVSDTEAVGPFPPDMIAACDACGGTDCEGNTWPVDQARALRGTDPCWPGTEADESGYLCIDEENAWGPFTPGMVQDCKDAGGGDVTCEHMRWSRAFAENLIPTALGQDWGWIMPIDLGIRDDAGGGGAFSAPRANNPGGHSGIDFLAPVGTPLLAPCAGPVISGVAGGYGNYVQISCAIPDTIAEGESLYASLLFGHLDSIAVSTGTDVEVGDTIGTVGKTGNAGSSVINAHVHFEFALASSIAGAQGESHASSNHSGNAASDLFEPLFEANCLDETGFVSLTGPTMKGRRPDPFMLLTCLVYGKPTLEPPSSSLQSGWTQWSEHYDADAFDVDVGIE